MSQMHRETCRENCRFASFLSVLGVSLELKERRVGGHQPSLRDGGSCGACNRGMNPTAIVIGIAPRWQRMGRRPRHRTGRVQLSSASLAAMATDGDRLSPFELFSGCEVSVFK